MKYVNISAETRDYHPEGLPPFQVGPGDETPDLPENIDPLRFEPVAPVKASKAKADDSTTP